MAFNILLIGAAEFNM